MSKKVRKLIFWINTLCCWMTQQNRAHL